MLEKYKWYICDINVSISVICQPWRNGHSFLYQYYIVTFCYWCNKYW